MYVALRMESVGRNLILTRQFSKRLQSLSAWRAWVEISAINGAVAMAISRVALRMESVGRNGALGAVVPPLVPVALRMESVGRNSSHQSAASLKTSRSPHGERG